MRSLCFIILLLFYFTGYSQVQHFPYIENFDSVIAPSLPSGWMSSTNRSALGDFTTTTSTVFSLPNSVLSTNATINQVLVSPILNFIEREADSLKYYERRSASHNSGVLIEASTNGGSTYSIIIGDTLKNPGVTTYVLKKFELPAELSNKPNIRIRWNIIGNGTGSTGTFRIDDVFISALSRFDAEIKAVRFLPEYPVTGDSIIISATIKNGGIQPIQYFPIEFYDDINSNGQAEASELFSSVEIDQLLNPNDTVVVSAKYSNLNLGEKNFIIKCCLVNDQNTFNDLFIATLSVGLPKYSIVINEIMYAPHSPEPEWIEIFNATQDSIDLKNWKLSNRNIVSKYLITSAQTYLCPSNYCIITKDISLLTAVHPDIPSLVIQSQSLPTYLFNNNGDAVVLYDSRGAIMDSVRYYPEWGGSDGYSLELIEHNVNSNDPSNWGTSKDSSGSTPGCQNYLTPLEYDLRCVKIVSKSPTPSSVELAVMIRNVGRYSVDSFSVSLFKDKNRDSIPNLDELLYKQYVTTTLLKKDSMDIYFHWNNAGSGRKYLIAVVDYGKDMRTSDNIVCDDFAITYPLNSLIINEIMYEPSSDESEYVELYNLSDESIDIWNWKLTDKRDTNQMSTKYLLTDSSYVLKPKEFLVLAFDSSIFNRFSYLMDSSYKVIMMKDMFSLNNNGDNVLLIDMTEQLIDSVNYFPSWHNPEIDDVSGRSLERINPTMLSNDRRNWTTSANYLGGTPGKQNSVYTASIHSVSTISFSPNPFSPDGDGHEDVTIMNYNITSTSNMVRVRIYDIKGRLVRTLADGEPSSANGEIIWDGFNDRREKVRMGIYIVLLEALDSMGGNVQTVKGTIVVAAKL